MPIRILSPDVVSRIAAGEVVQRPASVVKELVENSIDAGARRVQVELRRGGIEFIRVADDGCGIPSGEVELAFHHHATSKISDLEDTLRVGTLGFRGEALPSIAAVSRVTLVTRAAEEDVGTSITVDAGRVIAMSLSAASVGTVVTVRDLFYNVPARLKWLRSPVTEAAQAALVAGNLALAYPEVAVSLVVDGRLIFRTEGDGDLLNAIAAVYGWEAADSMVPLKPTGIASGIEITGYVSRPSYHRPNRQQLAVFVNRRWVVQRALMGTVADAYRTLLMVGRYPAATIDIRVEASKVDVNVHPAKTEVRLSNEAEVCAVLHRAVREALEGDRVASVLVPSLQIEAPGGAISSEQQMPLEVPGSSPDRSTQLPRLRVVGQVANTYIVAEGANSMYLIDQHAAHERVLYERFKERLDRAPLEVQPLLEPVVLELMPAEMAALAELQESLNQLGFEVEPFGGNYVLVRSVPAAMAGDDLSARFRAFLGEVLSGGRDGLVDRVAISLACHSAIRAGQVLGQQEMEHLVEDLARCRMPRACAHGRPTMLELHQNLLERQFGRR